MFFEFLSGYMDLLHQVFTKSLPQSGRSVLRPGDCRIILLCFYIPALFTESFDRLGRRIVFTSKVPEWGSNWSYTAKVDPFPSALSTRPTPLPLFFFVCFSIVSYILARKCPNTCFYLNFFCVQFAVLSWRLRSFKQRIFCLHSSQERKKALELNCERRENFFCQHKFSLRVQLADFHNSFGLLSQSRMTDGSDSWHIFAFLRYLLNNFSYV